MTENATEQTPSHWVHIINPETEGKARVTREAFEQTWKAKGWEEASPSEVAAAELTGGQVTDLNKLTVPELEKVAGDRGIQLPEGAKKPQIVETLEQAATPQT